MSSDEKFVTLSKGLEYTGSTHHLKHGDVSNLFVEEGGVEWMKNNPEELTRLLRLNGGELIIHDYCDSEDHKTTTLNIKEEVNTIAVYQEGEILKGSLRWGFTLVED